jgi:hypothetical protein
MYSGIHHLPTFLSLDGKGPERVQEEGEGVIGMNNLSINTVQWPIIYF